VNWVTTADECEHTADATKLSSCVTSAVCSHRRDTANETQLDSFGVYWALPFEVMAPKFNMLNFQRQPIMHRWHKLEKLSNTFQDTMLTMFQEACKGGCTV